MNDDGVKTQSAIGATDLKAQSDDVTEGIKTQSDESSGSTEVHADKCSLGVQTNVSADSSNSQANGGADSLNTQSNGNVNSSKAQANGSKDNEKMQKNGSADSLKSSRTGETGKSDAKKAYKEDRAFERWFAFLRFVERFMRIFYPYKRHNAVEKYDVSKAYVLLCNHYSMLDVMYPAAAMKKPVYFMAKKELWENKFLAWFCTKCRCIPVSRDGAAIDVKGIMTAMKYLKSGKNILIYPEGTRNKGDVDMLPFHAGFAAIAIKTRTPIIPIVQSGKPRLFRKSHVFFGAPIEFTEYYGKKLTEADLAECEKRLRNIMLKMRNDYFEEQARKKAEKHKK